MKLLRLSHGRGCHLLALFSLIAVFSAYPAVGQSKEEKSVNIGFIAPLSGDSAFWGRSFLRGALLALKDLNASKNNGSVRYRLVTEDDECDSKKSVAAYKKLANTQGIRYFIGPVCSSTTLAVAPLVEREKTPLLACSESAEISHAGGYLFKLYLSNDLQGRRLAQTAFGISPRAGVITIQNAYGSALSRAFKEEYERLGGKIVSFEEYDPSTVDFAPMLIRAKSWIPDVMMLMSYPKDGSVILRQLKQIHFPGRLIGASTLNSPDFFSGVGDLAEGIVIADMEDKTSADLRARWTKEYGEAWPGVQSCAPAGYTAVQIFASVLETGGDPAAVKDRLAGLHDFQSIMGPINFDYDGSLVGTHSMFIRKNGATQRLE